jgi:hypothetical protein
MLWVRYIEKLVILKKIGANINEQLIDSDNFLSII